MNEQINGSVFVFVSIFPFIEWYTDMDANYLNL